MVLYIMFNFVLIKCLNATVCNVESGDEMKMPVGRFRFRKIINPVVKLLFFISVHVTISVIFIFAFLRRMAF